MKFKQLFLLGLASLTMFSALGITSYDQAEAATVASLSSADKKVLESAVGDTSNILSVTSSKKTDLVGESDISGYRWTAWYNQHSQNFNIDKSQTSGTFKTGFPKTTTSASTNTGFTKTGYYKYLRDPIYSKLTLKATQTFNYVERVEKTKQVTYGSNYKHIMSGKDARLDGKRGWFGCNPHEWLYMLNASGLTEHTSISTDKLLDLTIKNQMYGYREEPHPEGPYGYRFIHAWSKFTVKSGNEIVDVYFKGTDVGYTKEEGGNDDFSAANFYGDADVNMILMWSITKPETYYENESRTKTVEIANTVVGRNVSATELAKYNTFNLVYKGNTSAKNTTISKSNSGWWGRYSPSYHNGTTSTSDSSGGSHYYTFANNTSGGTSSYRLYSAISKKEKLFTQKAVDTSITKESFKYNLKINPNGGTYEGNSSTKSVDGVVNTGMSIANPVREGYTFINWTYSGEGTWNASSRYYKFTGDGTLTAKWIKNSQVSNDGIEFTLTINPNGGRYNYTTNNTKVTQVEGGTYSIASPTRSGYLFDGWEVTSGDAAYLTQSKYNLMSSYAFYGNATIKAKWIKSGNGNGDGNGNGNGNGTGTDNNANSGTLSIDPNGGTYQDQSGIVTISQKAGTTLAIYTPVREGYAFDGWEIDTNNDVNGVYNTSNRTFLFKRGQSVLKARWRLSNPTNCVIDGTGDSACPDSERQALNKFIHLVKGSNY